ncbi:MAG: TrkA family potassium uptake protein [Firmicutes bacterium]|jgi:trk system potassium uptake protein TrkA|nr:TrkA family potassium uptake protein [Bacillota bacterium]
MAQQFAVIGLGRFGMSVARTLSELGQEVFAIDVDEDKVQRIAPVVTHAVVADVADIEAMRSIGIRNVDVAVITVGSEVKASMVGTMVLRELGVRTIVAKANDDLHGKVLEKLGADRVVYPERDGGSRLARVLTSTNLIEQIDLDPDYSIVEMTAPSSLAGKSLAELAVRARFGVYVMAIRSGDVMTVAPGADDVIREDDVLVVIGRNDRLQRFRKA